MTTRRRKCLRMHVTLREPVTCDIDFQPISRLRVYNIVHCNLPPSLSIITSPFCLPLSTSQNQGGNKGKTGLREDMTSVTAEGTTSAQMLCNDIKAGQAESCLATSHRGQGLICSSIWVAGWLAHRGEIYSAPWPKMPALNASDVKESLSSICSNIKSLYLA